MRYISTRGGAPPAAAGQAILKGLAGDGGLYVPERIPPLPMRLDELAALPYPALAYEILRLFLTDYEDKELRSYVEKAYSAGINFSDPAVAPLREAGGVYFLELFHGRTLAFKDMALSLLPYLLTGAAEKYRPGVKTAVLTATSGDTGKAALEGFAGVDGVSVTVFYPEDGVSPMQKRQMVTQEGGNVTVIGVRGNFDDTQTGVKNIFSDSGLVERMEKEGLAFSSANSINIGRLLPQIVYYVYAYGQLMRRGAVKAGDTADFTVPTGNFGNIMAGYYAKQMGLPIGRLVCASNQNKVLYDFFRTGVYDVNRAFYTTSSPSMDILVSSNLERLLYHASGDAAKVRGLMAGLSGEGAYRFDPAVLPGAFYAAFATGAETGAAISEMAGKGYVTDPHTAVAYHAYKQFALETGRNAPHVIVATASPYKFAADVCAAVKGGEEKPAADEARLLEELSAVSKTPIPKALTELFRKEIRHSAVCGADEMKRVLIDTVIFPQAR